jgi:hypothetical protein
MNLRPGGGTDHAAARKAERQCTKPKSQKVVAMTSNVFYEVVSLTVSKFPDHRSTAEEKADSVGADELLNRADWVLRERPELLYACKRRYRDLCRLLYRVIERNK